MEQVFLDQECPELEDSLPLDHESRKPFYKSDGRLFPTYPLYSEGMRRPKLRGYFHGVASLSLIVALAVLLRDCRHSPTGQIVSTLYILSKLCCYGSSSLFHIFAWSPPYEKFFQKLDHCGIAVLSMGLMLPTSVFLLGPIYGTFLMSVSFILCVINCINVFRLKPSTNMQILVAIWWFFPFWKPLFALMTTFEFSCMIAVIALNGAGVYVFSNEYPDPIPHIFGYHELFHVLVVLAGLCIFAANWSIIHRFCDDDHIIAATKIDTGDSASRFFHLW